MAAGDDILERFGLHVRGFMRAFLVILVIAVLLGVVAYGVGHLIPAAQEDEITLTINATPEIIQSVIDKVSDYPAWAPNAARIRILNDQTQPAWQEEYSGQSVYFWTEYRDGTEWRVSVRAAQSIESPHSAVEATWTIEFEAHPDSQQTTVRARQHSVYSGPMYRTLGYIQGAHRLEAYLEALKKRVEER